MIYGMHTASDKLVRIPSLLSQCRRRDDLWIAVHVRALPPPDGTGILTHSALLSERAQWLSSEPHVFMSRFRVYR